MRRFVVVTWVIGFALGSHSTAAAQEGPRQPDATWVTSSGTSVALFPSGDIYSPYVADPHRPTNIIEESAILGGGITGMESPVTRLAAGGRFGVLRIGRSARGGRSWQVSLEAGLDALFDSQNRLDVVGWDGNYGLTVTTASSGPLALKIAVLHVSAHVGDEHFTRTGRTRINYTREEVSVGARWRWSPRWHMYGETGVAYRTGDPSLEPWRAQAGLEWDSGPGPCGKRIACYAAADVLAMQERDWRVDATINFGILTHGVGRTTRIFLEWHDGRPTVNEFFQDSVTSLSLGLKIDL